MSLSKFKLVNEAEDSYHLAGPDGKTFTVDKQKLSPQAQAIIAKMKKISADSTKDDKMPKRFADGGMSSDNQDMTPQQMSTMPLPTNQSTIAQSNQAMDQQRQQEEPGLEESHPEDLAMLAGPIAAKGIKAGAEMIAPLISNEIGAVGANVSKLAAQRGAEHFIEPLGNSITKALQGTENLPNRDIVKKAYNNAAETFLDNLPKTEISDGKALSKAELSNYFESSPGFKAADRNKNLNIRQAENPNLPSLTKDAFRGKAKGGEIQKFASKGFVSPDPSIESIPADDTPNTQQFSAPDLSSSDMGGQGVLDPNLQPAPVPVQPNAPTTTPQTTPAVTDPYAAMNAAQLQLAQAQGAAGKAESGAIGSTLKAAGFTSENMQKQLATVDQNKANEDVKNKAFEEFLADPKNNITTDHLWNNLSPSGKVMTAIGIFLHGGAGQMMQTLGTGVIPGLVDADIKTQQANRDNTMNLYKIGRAASSSDQEAKLRLQQQYLTVASEKAKQMALASQSPIAMAQYQILKSQSDYQRNMANQILAIANPSLESSGPGGAAGTEYDFGNRINALKAYGMQGNKSAADVATEMNKRFIPGEGYVAHGDIPLPADKERLSNLRNFNNLANQALQFQQTGPGGSGGAWSPANRQAANSLRGQILAAAPSLLLDIKRYNPDLADTITGELKSPGSWDMFGRNAAALKQLQSFATSRHNELAKGMGVTPFKQSPIDAQAVAYAQSHPEDPRSQLILQKNSR